MLSANTESLLTNKYDLHALTSVAATLVMRHLLTGHLTVPSVSFCSVNTSVKEITVSYTCMFHSISRGKKVTL